MSMFLAAVGITEVIGGLLGVLLLWLLPSYLVARLAQRKGRSFGLWFGFALAFSWFALLIAILILPAHQGGSGTAVQS
jgi:hypothetical protein